MCRFSAGKNKTVHLAVWNEGMLPILFVVFNWFCFVLFLCKALLLLSGKKHCPSSEGIGFLDVSKCSLKVLLGKYFPQNMQYYYKEECKNLFMKTNMAVLGKKSNPTENLCKNNSIGTILSWSENLHTSVLFFSRQDAHNHTRYGWFLIMI